MEADKVEKADKRKVGRPGLSYDQIAQAANELRAAGRSVTIDAVRQTLGNTGGKGTIHAALKVWREANPPTQMAAPELPSVLLRAIRDELDRVAAEARAEIQERLIQAQDSADGLAENVNALEAEQEILHETVALLTSERDQAMALAQARAQEIHRLGDALAREQAAAEAARVELARVQLKGETETARVQEQAQEIAHLREALTAQVAARQEAERDLVEARTRLEAERDAKAEVAASAEARCQALIGQVEDLKARLNRAEASLEKAREAYAVLVGKASNSKPSPEAAQEEELLKPQSPPPTTRKRSGAQLQDRQT